MLYNYEYKIYNDGCMTTISDNAAEESKLEAAQYVSKDELDELVNRANSADRADALGAITKISKLLKDKIIEKSEIEQVLYPLIEYAKCIDSGQEPDKITRRAIYGLGQIMAHDLLSSAIKGHEGILGEVQSIFLGCVKSNAAVLRSYALQVLGFMAEDDRIPKDKIGELEELLVNKVDKVEPEERIPLMRLLYLIMVRYSNVEEELPEMVNLLVNSSSSSGFSCESIVSSLAILALNNKTLYDKNGFEKIDEDWQNICSKYKNGDVKALKVAALEGLKSMINSQRISGEDVRDLLDVLINGIEKVDTKANFLLMQLLSVLVERYHIPENKLPQLVKVLINNSNSLYEGCAVVGLTVLALGNDLGGDTKLVRDVLTKKLEQYRENFPEKPESYIEIKAAILKSMEKAITALSVALPIGASHGAAVEGLVPLNEPGESQYALHRTTALSMDVALGGGVSGTSQSNNINNIMYVACGYDDAKRRRVEGQERERAK